MLLCVEIAQWFIEHTNETTKHIYNNVGKMISSFLPIDTEAGYMFP